MSDSGVESTQSAGDKFNVLLSVVGRLPDQEIVDAALNLLVAGKFDLEAAFLIHSGESLLAFLDFVRAIEPGLQAQVYFS